MHVEVNEQNIILYGLVQLTGNSAEEMLLAARRAELDGYVLTCEVPDTDDININIFESAESTPAEPTIEHQNRIMDAEEGKTAPAGRVIGVHFDETGAHEVVLGEATEKEE